MVTSLNIMLIVCVEVGIVVQCCNAFVLDSSALVQLSDGGKDADPNGIARSVVQIVRNGRTLCTGSIIDSFTVLTAKHCFQRNGTFWNTTIYKFEVVYGSIQRYDPENAENFRRVSILYDGYHHHPSLDATILYLANEMIGAIPMEFDDQSSTWCMSVQQFGFGKLDGTGTVANVMQVMDTVVKTGCGELWYDPEDMIITQIESRTACAGDSGGPLVNAMTGEMVGIVKQIRGKPKPNSKSKVYNCQPGDRNYSIKVSKLMINKYTDLF